MPGAHRLDAAHVVEVRLQVERRRVPAAARPARRRVVHDVGDADGRRLDDDEDVDVLRADLQRVLVKNRRPSGPGLLDPQDGERVVGRIGALDLIVAADAEVSLVKRLPVDADPQRLIAGDARSRPGRRCRRCRSAAGCRAAPIACPRRACRRIGSACRTTCCRSTDRSRTSSCS